MPSTIIAAAIEVAVSDAAFTWATVALAAAKNLAIKFAISALSPKPRALQQNATPVAGTQTLRQPLVARQVIYGTDRTGGALTFACNSGSGAYLNLVITWAGHRVKGVRQLIANDEALVVDDDGWMVQGRYRGFFGFESALGTETGQPFQFAESYTGGQWSANHRQSGCAKSFIRMVRNREVFQQGIPNFSAVIDGYDNIYDPRDASNKFTTNPALIAADYLTNATFNKDAGDWAIINETALIAAANICDERLSTVYTPSFTVNATTDVLTFAADETQFRDGDCVLYATTGGAAGGLTNGALYYYFRDPTDTGLTKGKLATTAANATAQIAIDLTSAGSGTQTLRRVNTFTVDATRNRLTFDVAERRFEYGDGVRVASDTTLPTGLAANTTYYVIPISDTQIALASSVANAFARTAIAITSAGSGIHRLYAWDEARYTLNGSFGLDEKPQDILASMAEAMAGHIIKIGALWEIIAGAYSSPGDTLTVADLDGGISVQVMSGRSESANGVRGTFIARENYWQPTDMAPVSDATYLAQDNDVRVWKDVRYALVRGHARARRLAQIELRKMRDSLTVGLSCKLRAFRVKPGDIIGLTLAAYGWTNQPFRVMGSKLVLRGDGDKKYFGVDLTLQQISSTRYDWDPADNPAALIKRNTRLPDFFDLAKQAPPRVSGLEIPGQGLDGTFTGPDLHLRWRRLSLNNRFEIGSEPDVFGADAGTLDSWLEGYRVVIYDTSLNIVNDRIPVLRDANFTYTLARNKEDQVALTGLDSAAPIREGVVLVWAKSRLGLYSALPARLDWANPLPTTSNVSASATVDGLRLQYDRPADLDWAGIEICASTVAGFTPDTTAVTGNLVYRGTDIPALVRGLSPATVYYYQYRLRDQFGAGDWSGELSITTLGSIDQAISSPSDTAINAGSLGTEKRIVLAAAEVPTYPTQVPARLECIFTGQATCGASGEYATVTWYHLLVTSKPAVTGTFDIVLNGGGTWYDATGTGTNFSSLQNADVIYLGAGKPLLRISGTPSSDTVARMTPAVSDPGPPAYTASGLSFTAYRGTVLSPNVSPASDSRQLAASAVQDLTTTASAKLSGTGYTRILSVAQGFTLSGNQVDFRRSVVNSKWLIGANI